MVRGQRWSVRVRETHLGGGVTVQAVVRTGASVSGEEGRGQVSVRGDGGSAVDYASVVSKARAFAWFPLNALTICKGGLPSSWIFGVFA